MEKYLVLYYYDSEIYVLAVCDTFYKQEIK